MARRLLKYPRHMSSTTSRKRSRIAHPVHLSPGGVREIVQGGFREELSCEFELPVLPLAARSGVGDLQGVGPAAVFEGSWAEGFLGRCLGREERLASIAGLQPIRALHAELIGAAGRHATAEPAGADVLGLGQASAVLAETAEQWHSCKGEGHQSRQESPEAERNRHEAPVWLGLEPS